MTQKEILHTKRTEEKQINKHAVKPRNHVRTDNKLLPKTTADVTYSLDKKEEYLGPTELLFMPS